jgi:hypothetical protein
MDSQLLTVTQVQIVEDSRKAAIKRIEQIMQPAVAAMLGALERGQRKDEEITIVGIRLVWSATAPSAAGSSYSVGAVGSQLVCDAAAATPVQLAKVAVAARQETARLVARYHAITAERVAALQAEADAFAQIGDERSDLATAYDDQALAAGIVAGAIASLAEVRS